MKEELFILSPNEMELYGSADTMYVAVESEPGPAKCGRCAFKTEAGDCVTPLIINPGRGICARTLRMDGQSVFWVKKERGFSTRKTRGHGFSTRVNVKEVPQ